MKERESAAIVAGGLCFIIAAMRMFAPALPFDWMTLVLVLAAAFAFLLPALAVRAGQMPTQRGGAPAPEWNLSPLHQAMRDVKWEAKAGAPFDALQALYKENPFSALCAARGMLAMLRGKASPGEKDAAALSLLVEALDTAASLGERAATSGDVEVLFSYAVRALGLLDTI